MFRDIKITKKFPLVMIIFALVSSLVTGIIACHNAEVELEKSAKNTLSSLLDSRKASLENYFYTIEQDLTFQAKSPLVLNALQDFSKAWAELPGDKTKLLQTLYIDQNPYPVKQKDALLASNDRSLYSDFHRRYHPDFRNLATLRAYYDLFLFDTAGNLVYSVIKERDFATNMVHGEWKHTHLAEVFNAVKTNPEPGRHVFIDFSSYEPSNNAPASFIGTPVYDKQAKYIGVLAFQMPIDRLNKVMQVTAGMGESGETYLVGSDLLMRSDSRFFKGRSILSTKVDTASVRDALKGGAGVKIIQDYRGVPVFSAYSLIDFLSTRWAIIAEIDESEIMRPVDALNTAIFFSGLLIMLLICFVGYYVASDIAEPIVAMTKMMGRLAKNKLDTNISIDERKDEVGDLAEAMIVFKKHAIERKKLQQKLSYITQHDTLTGLHSRQYIMDYLDALLNKSKEDGKHLVLMFLDLDDFKKVNDELGHQAGDELLKEVANRLSACVREGDVVARLGGDEFIVILPDLGDKANVDKIAEKTLDVMDTDFICLGEKCRITASIGIAIFPQHAETSYGLIRKADGAMYLAKKKGKNKYCYPDESP